MKKIKFYKEAAYIVSLAVLALAVSLIASTGFGLSMVVAPAYLVSVKFPVLTFGQSEYVVQALLFIVMCLILKKIKIAFFMSFLSGVIYGFILDAWRILPHLNPDITAPGSLPLHIRIIFFACGLLLTAFSIALAFRSYLYPQVYDFFVMAVAGKLKMNEGKFKLIFDLSFLVLSVALTFIFFGKLTGIGIGTFIAAFLNGFLISAFGKLFDKVFVFTAAFKKLSERFELE